MSSVLAAWLLMLAAVGVLWQGSAVAVYAQQFALQGLSNLTTQQGTPVSSRFTVLDANPATVQFAVLSSDENVIPSFNVVISAGSTPAERTLTVRPSATSTGTVTLTLFATNSSGETITRAFMVTVMSAGMMTGAPVIGAIEPIATAELQTQIVPFTITDANPATVQVTAVSLDQALLPNASIMVGGAGVNRLLTVTPPATGRLGRVVVRLTATNQNGLSSTRDVDVRISAAPADILPEVGIQSTVITTPSRPITVDMVLQDVVNVNTLRLSAISSNEALIPPANISFAGTGTQRTVTFTPVAGRTGQSNVIIFAINANGRAGRAGVSFFALSPNDPPLIGAIPNLRTSRNTPVNADFTLVDANLATVRLTAVSSNPDLIPNTNVIFSGNGVNRMVSVVPALNQSGTAVITVTATNQNGASAQTAFTVTVVGPPVIQPVNPIRTTRNTPVTVPLTIVDLNPNGLRIVATSSNPTVLPNANIVVGGAGGSRTLTITPAQNQLGESIITLTVTNTENLSSTVTIPVTVVSPSAPPVLSGIQNIVTPTNTPALASFTVNDANLNTITLSAVSSNQALLPNSNIFFSGTGANRTVSIFPATNQTGTTQVTIVATNQDGLSTSTTFLVTVAPPPLAPSIQPVLALTTLRNTPVSAQFLVNDANVNALTFTVMSSNPALISPTNVLVSGFGNTRTVTVIPTTGLTGFATITLTVRNQSGLSASSTFTVTVIAPPTIGTIPTIFVAQNSSTTQTFTVADDNVNTLSFAITSSNPALIPVGNVSVSGTGTVRTLTVVAAPNLLGNSVLTLTATNSNGLMATVAFLVTVVAAPELDPIPDLVTTANTPVSTEIVVRDADVNALRFSTSSSVPAVIPAENVEVRGVGNLRTLTITPARNQLGSSMITLFASNGVARVSRTFRVTVVAPERTVPQPVSPTTGTVVLRVDQLDFSAVQFTWLPITGEQGAVFYNIQVTQDSTFNFVPFDVSSIPGSTAIISGFEPERIYFWRIRAQVRGRFGQWSDIYSFRTVRQRLGDGLLSAAHPVPISSQGMSALRLVQGVPDGMLVSEDYQSQPAMKQVLKQAQNASTQSMNGMKTTALMVQSPDGSVTLYPNAPNPFSESTRIEYEAIEPTDIYIYIVDVSGRRVADVVNTRVRGGRYSVIFSANDLPSGAYTCVLQTPRYMLRGLMILGK